MPFGRSLMPGMMDTVLNIGLTDVTAEGMVKLTGNPRSCTIPIADWWKCSVQWCWEFQMRHLRSRWQSISIKRLQT
jgi:hypothetical protein